MNSTLRLRWIAVWCWGLGFAIAAADRLSFSIGPYLVSYSYILFSLAFVACLSAEKKEFSTRVALYRLHDVAIYGPWRFLLLYFLWVSVFSPFTKAPLQSIVYCLGGWFSLLAVGFSAELVLCERSLRGYVFVPERLRVPFLLYTLSMISLFTLYGGRIFFPNLGIPVLNQDPVTLILYFTLGFPFLLWDFMKSHRHLVPRPLSGVAIVLGVVNIFAMGKIFFLFSVMFYIFGLVAVGVYKKIHLRHFFYSLLLLLLLSLAGLLALRYSLSTLSPAVVIGLRQAQNLVQVQLVNSVTSVSTILRDTNYLGLGLGLALQKGVWSKVLAEAGVIGLLFYGLYFLDLLLGLYRIRHAPRIVVSNVAFLSVIYFMVIGSHYLINPYGAYIWAWYAIWTVFSAYYRKKETRA